MDDIRAAGFFIFGFLFLALAFYSLQSIFKAPNLKEKMNGLMGFLSLIFLALAVVFLGIQSFYRKC